MRGVERGGPCVSQIRLELCRLFCVLSFVCRHRLAGLSRGRPRPKNAKPTVVFSILANLQHFWLLLLILYKMSQNGTNMRFSACMRHH